MNKVTVILAAVTTAIVASAPTWMPFIPPPYAAVAAGAVALLSSVYHLYQAPPNVAK